MQGFVVVILVVGGGGVVVVEGGGGGGCFLVVLVAVVVVLEFSLSIFTFLQAWRSHLTKQCQPNTKRLQQLKQQGS